MSNRECRCQPTCLGFLSYSCYPVLPRFASFTDSDREHFSVVTVAGICNSVGGGVLIGSAIFAELMKVTNRH